MVGAGAASVAPSGVGASPPFHLSRETDLPPQMLCSSTYNRLDKI